MYRIRSGRRIGSAALVADGYHARIDGFTSLAVVAGVVGVALGFELADPIIGLLISLAIFRIVWQSLRSIGLRAMDGVEAGTVEAIRAVAATSPGVLNVDDIRARWVGHGLQSQLTVSVDGDLTVTEATEMTDAVRVRLVDEVDHLDEATVELRPMP